MTQLMNTDYPDPTVLELSTVESIALLRKPDTKRLIRHIAVPNPRSLDPSMSERSTHLLERRLNSWYFACGCEQGSVGVFLTLFISLMLGFRRGFDGSLAWWRVTAYVFGAALIGKAVGLAYAKARLGLTLKRLESSRYLAAR